MKNSILIFSALLIALPLTGCFSSKEKKEQAEEEVIQAHEALEKADKAYLEDLKAYKAETEKVIADNQEYIADLRIQTAKEKEDLRTKNMKKIEDLERQNIDLQNKLYNYPDYNNSNWDIFKAEFTQEMNELKEAIIEFPRKNNK